MRWLLLLLVVATGILLGGAGLVLLRADEPVQLLPDLDQAAPSAVSVVQAGDTYRVTFASAVDNVGRGPLVLAAARSSPAEAAMRIRQIVRSSNGAGRSVEVEGELRYVRAETHAHWHFLEFERYELRRAGDGKLVGRDRKTGFCLGDRYDVDRNARLPNEPENPVWTEECGRGKPSLLTLAQGISPGYGDDYVPRLEGQYLDVTSLPEGRYVLVHRVNPAQTLVESDYANNAASLLIALRRPTSDIPAVEVLARCADSPRCPAG